MKKKGNRHNFKHTVEYMPFVGRYEMVNADYEKEQRKLREKHNRNNSQKLRNHGK